ncbi:hypothetical protein IU485_27835 [Nocardia cyriacigeorgica]|uniref:hypothetical protein n=1 Tax=Nocardia cyriacigeorgica TaxID=135487 RepID=UPI0018953A3C|nr:hypothetical protein [Nocardia cyriacigeorgica]MBF6085189.1 hypothetical protein [Nocardia cyriacigeorgica]
MALMEHRSSDCDGEHYYGPMYFRDNMSAHNHLVDLVGRAVVYAGGLPEGATVSESHYYQPNDEGGALYEFTFDRVRPHGWKEGDDPEAWQDNDLSYEPDSMCPCTCAPGQCLGHRVSSVHAYDSEVVRRALRDEGVLREEVSVGG